MRSSDAILVIASVLVLAAAFLNLVGLRDASDSYWELTLRARLVAVIRLHPRLRAVQVACWLIALALYIAVVFTG